MRQELTALVMGLGLCVGAAADVSRPVVRVAPGANVQRALDAAPDGAEIRFAAGDYPVDSELVVTNRRDLLVRGETGARFVIRFEPVEAKTRTAQGFVCRDLKGITFENLVFTTDRPVNCNGTVVAIDAAHDTYDVEIDEGFPIDTRQVFAAANSVGADGAPSAVLECQGETPYEIVGPRTIRAQGPRRTWAPNWRYDYANLKLGQRIVYRFLKSGRHVFLLSDCADMVFRDITVERSASFVVRIRTRSRNATFERFVVRAPAGAREILAGNADGIHVEGLSGALVLKDCHFRGLGDDALNVHALAGFVKAYDPATGALDIRRRSRRTGEGLHADSWARTGDEIVVYDPKTFLEKGRFVLDGHRKGRGRVTNLTGTLAVGDVLANRAFYPKVTVSGCTFENSRARGILLQSQDMLIENSRFAGHLLAGLLIAPDIRTWNEVGPAKNVEIRNCEFTRCGTLPTTANLGALVIKASHDVGSAEYPAGVHENVSIHGNDFHDNGTRGIYVSAVKGLDIRDNRFARNAPAPDGVADCPDVRTVNCEAGAAVRAVPPVVRDALTPARLADVKVGGFVGRLQDRLLDRRVRSAFAREEIWKEARDAFAHPDDDVFYGGVGMWKGEFWGKLMIGACRVAEHTGDAALKAFLHEEGLRLIAFQRPDGYLGTYTDPDNVLPLPLGEARRRVGWDCTWNWNLWCRKYTLWGLLSCGRLTGDRRLLDAADRAMANEVATLRRLGLRLCDTGTGTMRGLPPCSVLKPLLWLYADTGKQDWLDFAREVVGSFADGESRAPQFAARLAESLPLDAWYPSETGRWGKAYEMMSVLDGFVEFYRLTGDRAAFAVAEGMQGLIRAGELNLCGSVGYNDQFVTARRCLNGVSEPCDAIHWMRLNLDLYLLTGAARYADAFEGTLYNAFLASVRPDGAWGARCVRSHGRHQPAPPQSGMRLQHCCVNNLPRGFMDAAKAVLARDAAGTLHVALYHDASARLGEDAVEISGDYPVGDRVTVRVTRAAPGKVRFRVPAWCARLALAGPGVARTVRTPGWAEVDAPAGASAWTLAFDMAPRVVGSCRPATDDVPPDDGRRRRWCDPKTEADLQGLFVTKPYAQVQRGPLLLAKSVRLGTAPTALVPTASVNDGLQSKGLWTLVAERIPAADVWGAWRLRFRRGDETVETDACDYPSADTWRLGENAFSTLF